MAKEFKPGFWRHFKGNLYFAIADAKTVDHHNDNDELFGTARYCENASIEVKMYCDESGRITLQGDIPNGRYALYEQLYDSDFKKHSKWVRALEDFLGTKNLGGREVDRFKYLGKKSQPGTY